MSDDDARQRFREALENERAQGSRVYASREVSAALSACGRSLWVGSYVLQDKSAEGVAVLTEMAAELSQAAVELFSRELWYAGGGVVRQLIEAEYLFWLFAREDNAAESWVQSSPDQIRKLFGPASLRKRSGGQFRDREYWTHCDMGGHPNPKGRLLLRDHSNPLGSHAWLWLDLVQHLSRLWPSFRQCLVKYELHSYIDAEVLASSDASLSSWREAESPALLSIEIPGAE